MFKSPIAAVFSCAVLAASGGKDPAPAPANAAEIRIPNEVQPAGGTVQAKFILTESRPITTTGASFFLGGMAVDGIALFSANGDAAGVGFVRNNTLWISALSPSGSLGTTLDYPLLTVTLQIPATLPPGATIPLQLGSTSFIQGLTGYLTLSEPKPGTLTVGGSVSISGLYPGGGTWPAGTTIRVLGSGFVPQTQLLARGFKIASAQYVSPTEIDFTLTDATTIDTQLITVRNPDGSSDSYYSYLRGTPVSVPSHALLARAEPIFQLLTRSTATFSPMPPLPPGGFGALALQNPNAGPVSIMIESSSGASATFVLPSQSRIVDDVTKLLNGAAVNAGDTIKVFATSPIQVLGLLGDDNIGLLVPVLPVS